MSERPSILFVCLRNRSKSQMAEAMLRHLDTEHAFDIHSGGTAPGPATTPEAITVMSEVGIDMSGVVPKPIDPDLLKSVDRVVVIGHLARLDPGAGLERKIQHWRTYEPSQDGYQGLQRMRLLRDDLLGRVQQLHDELTGRSTLSSMPFAS